MGPCFPQHTTAQKGLNLRQREPVITRSTWVRWKLNSCWQAEGVGGVGDGAPRGGTVSSHSPPPHKPPIYKESLHLSASGAWDRFAVKERWAVLGTLACLGTRSRKEWRGKASSSAPSLLWVLGPRARPTWTDCQGRRHRGRDTLTPQTSPSQGTVGSHCLDQL